ncbi:MAG: hypothetical protein PHT40_00285 [Patescibacteria group bacterium]|nr:hypothetical protein [Patescibacteria group bacterium]
MVKSKETINCQENRLSEAEWKLITKTAAEFLQADMKGLVDWYTSLLTEDGKKFVAEELKLEDGEIMVPFVVYLYQKPKEERKKIITAINHLPEFFGLPGIGGHHKVGTFIDHLDKKIIVKRINKRNDYFIGKPLEPLIEE